MNPSSTLVNKLWRLCAVLRKDGITYQQYVTELTYLLFLKMVKERKEEKGRITKGYRWQDLLSREGTQRLTLYRKILTHLAIQPRTSPFAPFFDGAATFIREPVNLATLISAINELNWFSEERDAFGDLYEGLLQKNAEETKRGAGQYFTPRVLIDTIVNLIKPAPGEVIQDPAAGTGGFLIAANRSLRLATDDFRNLTSDKQKFQLEEALRGTENVPVKWTRFLGPGA